MTIDERLDRLTERHEALTRSVELIARTTQDFARTTQGNARQIGALGEAAASLLQIVQIHENRISGLEGGK